MKQTKDVPTSPIFWIVLLVSVKENHVAECAMVQGSQRLSWFLYIGH